MQKRGASVVAGWAVLPAMVLVLIIVPFVLFGSTIETRSLALTHAGSPGLRQFFVAVLLAGDVFLPVPSSIVSTAGGATLGFLPGTLASTVGMTAGALLGYWCGRAFGHPLLHRLVSPASAARAHALAAQLGPWAVAASRPVPVLAEASVLLAGVHRMPFASFMMSSTFANLGVSMVYAWAGSRSTSTASFLFAVGAALGLPAVAMLLSRRFKPETGV